MLPTKRNKEKKRDVIWSPCVGAVHPGAAGLFLLRTPARVLSGITRLIMMDQLYIYQHNAEQKAQMCLLCSNSQPRPK